MRFLLPLLLLLSFPAAAQVACQHVGHSIVCNRGQSFQNLGNTVFDKQGRAWQRQRLGNTPDGSGGTTAQDPGTTTFDKPGNASRRLGPSGFGSSGRGSPRSGGSLLRQ